ncbi:MAG TPA: transglutaminase domain-containing protein [Candidatus Binataceae bacterium]|nr:transglutaminase domain-containing protein [Candidatus Binataceae bacterium]
METPQDYYRGFGTMAAADARGARFDALPEALADLCAVVQGVLIHRDLAAFAYDVRMSEERIDDAHLRPLRAMLARIRAIDDRPLGVAREPHNRMAAVCRHFSLMLAAMLKARGVPARARCGFAAYFTPGRFEDHWVCEYWNAAQRRWVLVDAQIDAVQRNLFHPDFDPLDVPRDRFIGAGDAWLRCRNAGANAELFGLSFVPNLRGMWFIAGNVVRDVAALNRRELLPWDVWGMMPGERDRLSGDDEALLDRAAALTASDDRAFAQVRAIYQDERLCVPATVFNALRNRAETIEA